jgi:hypothetical protein
MSTYFIRVRQGDIYRVIASNLDEEARDYYIKVYKATFPDMEVVEEGGNKDEGDLR